MIGELIAGKYRVEGELGEGGMGAVYRARIVKNARPVAIKFLREEIVGVEQFESRFEAEVNVTAKVQHENIVKVYDHGHLSDGRRYLVLELLTGRSLGEIMHTSQHIEWRRALRITRDIARALEAVHEQEIVHRDIKPENIFLLPHKGGETAKLMDFGLAKTLVAPEYDQELTQPGFAIGTPTYMAPERVTGDYDCRSDLYGLAVVAYEMLVGKPPFDGEPTDILKDHLLKALPLPSEVRPEAGVPAAVERLLVKALAKKVEERFQSATELITSLDLLIVGDEDRTIFTPEAPEWTRWEQVQHYFRSRVLPPLQKATTKQKMIAVAGGLGLVVLTLGIIVGSSDKSSDPPDAIKAASPQSVAAASKPAKPATNDRADRVHAVRLATIEQALAEKGFQGTESELLAGAKKCSKGPVDGLSMHICVYESAEQASRGRQELADAEATHTSVAVTREFALVWIVDHADADPEGRKIQGLLEAFAAIE